MRAGRGGQQWSAKSPADERRSPREAAAHRLQHDEVAVLDAAVADGVVERERNGRRGRVAVPADGRNDLLLADTELPGAGVDDALIGLMRHEPVDVVRA